MQNKTRCILSVFVLSLQLAACATADQPVPKVENSEFTQCQDPRPEICTMDYRPVCGVSVSGQSTTYSNGCGACSHPDVVAYTEGECQTNVQQIQCQPPRQQTCTREYRPVCATLNDGQQRSYSNSCTACADEQVQSYRLQTCR